MPVKSVTAANLTEYVAERKSLGSEVKSPAEVATIDANARKTEQKVEGSVVVGTTTETVSTAPEPQGDAKEAAAKKDKKNPVQDRIDELTREKKELDEFAEGEYTARLQAQRRIAELESQIQSLQPKAEKPKEEPEPDPSKYTDQKLFLKDWGEWNRKKAIADFQFAEKQRRDKEETDRTVADLNARRERSLTQAKKELPDFDEVIRMADRGGPVPPDHVKGVLWESEHGAQILYHLAKNPEEAKRIFALRPAAAALALGRIETQYAKTDSKEEVKPTNGAQAPPQVTKAPPPMPSLAGASTETSWDPSAPQDYKAYKQRRQDELRRARRH